MAKHESTTVEAFEAAPPYDDGSVDIPEKYGGTAADRHDMEVLGKKQVFRRNFRLITMLGFSSTAVISWECLPIALMFALVDGGPPVLFWGLIVGPIGFSLVYASLAEMASMCPTAGGQYHWVSEFAPPHMQKSLSYAVGWTLAIGWQTWLAGAGFIVAVIIQGLIALNNPNYVFQRWHGTLLTIAVIFIAALVNILMGKRLPLLQYVVFSLHIFGFFGVAIPLWVTADRTSAKDVFLNFQDNGGWDSIGLSSMIGMVLVMSCLNGYDCIAHMAEDTEDASKTVPISMACSVTLNVILMIVMGLTLLFCLGDPKSALNTPTGLPFIQVFFNATQSYAGTTAMASIIAILGWSCCVNELATSSRQLWSFARDRGVPGSTWLSHVSHNVPFRAMGVCVTVTVLLSFINIGSTVAISAISSLGGIAFLSSYLISIGCVTWRRIWGAPLPPRRWSLGKFGLAVNIGALLFMIPFIFFFCWPVAQPVTAANLNWSTVIFSGVLLVALVYYIAKARHEYTGPVVQVKRL